MLDYGKSGGIQVFPPNAEQSNVENLIVILLRGMDEKDVKAGRTVKRELKIVVVIELVLLEQRLDPSQYPYVSTIPSISSNRTFSTHSSRISSSSENLRMQYWIPEFIRSVEVPDWEETFTTRQSFESNPKELPREYPVKLYCDDTVHVVQIGEFHDQRENKTVYHAKCDNRNLVAKSFKPNKARKASTDDWGPCISEAQKAFQLGHWMGEFCEYLQSVGCPEIQKNMRSSEYRSHSRSIVRIYILLQGKVTSKQFTLVDPMTYSDTENDRKYMR
jgi:hypothetical protein